MEVWHIGLGSLGFLFLFNFFGVYPLRRKIEEDPNKNILFRQISYSVTCSLASVATTGLVSAIAIEAGLFVVGRLQGTTAVEVGRTISMLQNWRSALQHIEPVIGIATLAALILAMIFLAWRQTKLSINRAIETARHRELDALRAQAETDGGLPELEPTKAMRDVARKLDDVEAEMREIIAAGVHRGGDDRDVQLTQTEHERFTQLREVSGRFHELYRALDVDRRLPGRLETTDVEVPQPTTLIGRIATFFLSRGQFRVMRFASKAVFFACIFLTVPSMLAIAAPNVSVTLDRRLDTLETVYVALNEDEALQSWEDFRRSPTVEEEKEATTETVDTLAAVDERAINRLAVALEVATARRVANALELTSTLRKATLRAQGTRIQLFNTYRKRTEEMGIKVGMRGFAEDAELTELHRAIVDFELEASMLDDVPATTIGKDFQRRLRESVPMADPARWDRIKRRIEVEWNDFQTLSSSRQMRSMFVTHLLFDGVETGLGVGDSLGDIARNIEDLVGKEPRRTMMLSSQARLLTGVEEEGLVKAVEAVSDPDLPPVIGRQSLDDLFINAQSFAGDDGFDRELRNFSPYLNEVTETKVDRAAAERLARTMADATVPDGYVLADALSPLVQFADIRSGADGRSYRPTRRVTPKSPDRVSRKYRTPRWRFGRR